MVRLLNAHADAVLCVSERAAAIAQGFGVDPARLRVCRIGSDHAAKWAETQPRPGFLRPDGTLKLAYLGYMRRDKGFFFLLDALERMPDAVARRLHLLIAAAAREDDALARLQAVRPRFASLDWADGYDRAGMDMLLADVDVGLIPVLWEDTLPQVAIEMHARHIPLLTADMGGARELGRCPEMVFRAGDAESLTDRLAAILDGRVDLARYWAGAMPPVTLEGHADALARLYAEARRPEPAPA
jgi:glycosyltransferase involved in cell wall biosynthesis